MAAESQQPSDRWYLRCALVLITCLIGMLAPARVAEMQGPTSGQPDVRKLISPEVVESGEPVDVWVIVTGSSATTDEPFPFDGVLTIDMSGSMAADPPHSDPNYLRLAAAKRFVECVDPDTRLAIVTFDEDATLEIGLTSDKDALNATLDGLWLQSGGGTNIYEAMQVSQNHLVQHAAPERAKYIVLLTDGQDTTGHSDSQIQGLAEDAARQGLTYFGVALGDEADLGLLWWIAHTTGGQAYASPDADGLGPLYAEICDAATHDLSTRGIILHEKLAGGLHVVPGSAADDLPGDLVSQFENTGTVSLEMHTLGSRDQRVLHFQVVADCLSPDAEAESVMVSVDDPSSIVTYYFGNQAGQVSVPLGSFECTRPGGALRVWKDFDVGTSTLTVTIESRYLPGQGDRTIRNIRVVEKPSHHFAADIASADPPLHQVFPGHLYDTLVWSVPALGPKEQRAFTVRVKPTCCSRRYAPPILVDTSKLPEQTSDSEVIYTHPDGTRDFVWIQNRSVTLPSVESCSGRPDLYLEPALTYDEYVRPPQLDPSLVLASERSPSIWVDSLTPNGYWDGSAQNIGAYVDGAELFTSGPRISGQGDRFVRSSENRIMTWVLNVDTGPLDGLPSGAKLYVRNNLTSGWDRLAVTALPTMDGADINTSGGYLFARKLVSFVVRPQRVQSQHVSPYSLPAEAAVEAIRLLNPRLASDIERWAQSNQGSWTRMVARRQIVPADLRDMLPDTCGSNVRCFWEGTLRTRFNRFLGQEGAGMAWGKPSIQARVALEGPASEIHTNNNVATVVLLTD